MELYPVGELLKGSKFDKKKVEIEQTFKAAKVKTLTDLDNAPRVLPRTIYGFSCYQIVSFLRKAQLERAAKDNAKELAKAKSSPVPASAPVKKEN